MNTAAKVREHKQAHPEMYCTVPSCLWRTGGQRGTPCRKHGLVAPPSVTRTVSDITDATLFPNIARAIADAKETSK